MTNITVYPIGTIVLIGNKKKREIEAEIVSVLFSHKGIEYHVTWWIGHEQKDIWLTQEQMDVKKTIKKIEIGFNNE